ncbi:MAG: hypothetical protein CNLJKLNK_00401 [Holosporales bacterium]
MSLYAALPFVLLLLGISFGPNFFPKVWHRIENYLISFVCILTICILCFSIGKDQTFIKIHHVLEQEYLPFLAIVFALYTVSTSLRIKISGRATPFNNALFLVIGGLLSNLIGTTGASMLLIHPLLKWNHHQKSCTHLVLFFIIMVSNIAGSLTPLGDPPLFVGYIQGVPFLWPLLNLSSFTFIGLLYLALLFYVWDKKLNKQTIYSQESFTIHTEGRNQLLFIPLIVGILMFCPRLPFLHEFLLLAIAGASYLLDRYHNNFLSKKGHWSPIFEVSRVFLAIFISLIPLGIILQEGHSGALGSILTYTQQNGTPNPTVYFWLSGLFSALLDNAPTYLLFLNMLGQDVPYILKHFNNCLIALTLGCVYFGAMTYIGNTPNFIIRNIAKQHGVSMPSFVGYIGYTAIILLPLLGVLSLFIR